jgi:hypothetical protein
MILDEASQKCYLRAVSKVPKMSGRQRRVAEASPDREYSISSARQPNLGVVQTQSVPTCVPRCQSYYLPQLVFEYPPSCRSICPFERQNPFQRMSGVMIQGPFYYDSEFARHSYEGCLRSVRDEHEQKMLYHAQGCPTRIFSPYLPQQVICSPLQFLKGNTQIYGQLNSNWPGGIPAVESQQRTKRCTTPSLISDERHVLCEAAEQHHMD